MLCAKSANRSTDCMKFTKTNQTRAKAAGLCTSFNLTYRKHLRTRTYNFACQFGSLCNEYLGKVLENEGL